MSGSGGAAIEIQSLRFGFDGRRVFEDLTCRFGGGEISVVMGGSGCGKTTLLRLVGGLQAPDAGTILLDGDPIGGLSGSRPEHVRRRFGMLFQGGALLDSMTIFENVALPLREHLRLTEGEVAEAVHRRLHAVGLEDIDHLLPGELSGGMLRRAALARAIVMDPEILLCDEPFSGLDPPNVGRIEDLLTQLNRELGLCVIVSSHHMASSLRMGHQIVLLAEGRAVSGTPRELATSHDSRILQFLGADGAAFAVQIAGASTPTGGPTG